MAPTDRNVLRLGRPSATLETVALWYASQLPAAETHEVGQCQALRQSQAWWHVQRAVTAAAAGSTLAGMDRVILAAGLVAYLAAMAAIHGVTVRRTEVAVVARLAAAVAIALLAAVGGALSAPAFMGALFVLVVGEALFEIIRARRGRRPTTL
jgi:hypothetical protein